MNIDINISISVHWDKLFTTGKHSTKFAILKSGIPRSDHVSLKENRKMCYVLDFMRFSSDVKCYT